MSALAPVAPRTGTAMVLGRMLTPYDPVRCAAALLGLPLRAAGQLVGTAVASSEHADALLGAMPQILRSMAIATTDRPERCHDELRGPVLWSETMSARAASAGDPGLFVCATTTKAYDTSENRILKAALAAIVKAGHLATQGREISGNDLLRHVRHNEQRARHLLEHRTLSTVPLTRVTGRMLRRTSTGSRRATYRPALSMLRHAQQPLRADALQAEATTATVGEHDLLAEALVRLDARLDRPPPLLNDAGGLAAGPVRYEHLGGVTVGGQLVTSAEEIDAALDRTPLGGP